MPGKTAYKTENRTISLKALCSKQISENANRTANKTPTRQAARQPEKTTRQNGQDNKTAQIAHFERNRQEFVLPAGAAFYDDIRHLPICDWPNEVIF